MKVARIKSALKKADRVLILKDTMKDGIIVYRTFLDKNTIQYYNKHKALPAETDLEIREITKE